jgi:hypothetical protein
MIKWEESMNRFILNVFIILIMQITSLVISCNLFNSSDISVVPSSNQIEKFETLYIDIKLSQPFANPYNPEDIKVDAIITTPEGDKLILPCFYQTGSSDMSQWEARFTAMQTGTHSYHIKSTSSQDTLISKTYQIEVKESGRNGFLRLNPHSKYSFLFDSGKRFRGVGMNLGWELQSEWKHTYETYFDELENNNANFIRTWMCTWNLPLEWTRVLSYDTFIDELENWDKTFSHTSGLTLQSGKTDFTEDDLNRITIQSNSIETIIYHITDIRRFKIKLFYHKQISQDKIKCYRSNDNKSYSPIDIEFSQTWNTHNDWHRIFIAYISDLPPGTNYFKIEFLENLEGSPHLGNVLIEHGEPKDILDAPGLGRYYQKTANRFDEILHFAEEKGIYIMLTHDYHGVFKSYIDRWASNAEWRTNPYNASNGGPCQEPEDFFTNPEAKQFYKNKLRYMVARWGYSTHLACWEFWNEIDNVMEWQNVLATAITSWHKEMADYLKKIDPYKHLVSTSVVYREVPGLWKIKNLDFTQHHNYGPTANMRESILAYVERFSKPDVVGEFALGWKGPDKDYPVELYEGELHNGIWRGMFSPTPILPMTWWWEWHYYQKHYYHFKMAAEFVLLMMKDKQEILQDLPVKGGGVNIEALGLKSGDNLYIWLRNSNKEVQNDLTLNIQGTENVKYHGKYYDTWTGKYSDDIEMQAINDQLMLNDIQLKGEHDMALLLIPAEK